VLEATSQERRLKTVELSRQQSARMAELPEDCRVVGVERRTPLVRKPSGQLIRIQQHGRMAAVARQRIANYEGRCLMPRIIVMPDATHLKEGINGTILYAEQVAPEHLDDLISSEQILERLEGAVRGERVTA
jgi:hypothetical protein